MDLSQLLTPTVLATVSVFSVVFGVFLIGAIKNFGSIGKFFKTLKDFTANADKMADYENLKRDYAAQEVNISLLRDSYETNRRQLTRLQAEVDRLQEKQIILEDGAIKDKAEITMLRNRVTELEGQLKAALDENRALKSELEARKILPAKTDS